MSSGTSDQALVSGGRRERTRGRYIIAESTAAETAELRRAVLRPHLRIDQMTLGGDQNPDTAYLSVRAAGRAAGRAAAMLGCVRLEPVPCPWAADLDVAVAEGASWQLRAMVTDPAVRGTGLGRLLVEAAVDHVATHGGDMIWCNARVTAQGFYARLGFRSVTERFVVDSVPEEHVGMVRVLGR